MRERLSAYSITVPTSESSHVTSMRLSPLVTADTVGVTGTASQQLMRMLSIWGWIRSIRTPLLAQPPKWCSAMTLCVSPDHTGEPEEPPVVSQK